MWQGVGSGQKIDRKYAEEAAKLKAEHQTFQMLDFRPGDPAEAYFAYLENLHGVWPLKITPAWTP